MKTALIISGGEFSSCLPKTEYDVIIACDKGYEYARKLKITPDYILGDFDSVDKEILNTIDKNIPVITYPVEKDDTDTMLAIKEAISLGATDITIICALGNRLDHTISNIQSLHYAAENNTRCEILSDSEHLRAFKGPANISIPKKKNYSLSIFSLTDSCEGLTIQGAKYNTEKITLKNSFPLGLGNSILSEEVSISFDSGILLISQSYMP